MIDSLLLIVKPSRESKFDIEINSKVVICWRAPVAYLLQHVSCIKAESFPQQPVFDSSPVPLLHVIPSLTPAFPFTI